MSQICAVGPIMHWLICNTHVSLSLLQKHRHAMILIPLIPRYCQRIHYWRNWSRCTPLWRMIILFTPCTLDWCYWSWRKYMQSSASWLRSMPLKSLRSPIHQCSHGNGWRLPIQFLPQFLKPLTEKHWKTSNNYEVILSEIIIYKYKNQMKGDVGMADQQKWWK